MDQRFCNFAVKQKKIKHTHTHRFWTASKKLGRESTPPGYRSLPDFHQLAPWFPNGLEMWLQSISSVHFLTLLCLSACVQVENTTFYLDTLTKTHSIPIHCHVSSSSLSIFTAYSRSWILIRLKSSHDVFVVVFLSSWQEPSQHQGLMLILDIWV